MCFHGAGGVQLEAAHIALVGRNDASTIHVNVVVFDEDKVEKSGGLGEDKGSSLSTPSRGPGMNVAAVDGGLTSPSTR